MAVVARGHVRDRPFARTIYTIAARQFTGDLVMVQGGRSYKVTWQDGAVAAAESSSPADSFGRIALTDGHVTSTQLGDVLRVAQANPQRSELAVLAEVARLSPQQVHTIKRRAFAHCAVRVFALPEATFVLDSEPTLLRDDQLALLGVRWLIYQGLRTHYSEERLAAELENALDATFRLLPQAEALVPEYGLGADAMGCMTELGGRAMTLDELSAAFPRMTRKALLALVYALLATDALGATKPAQQTIAARPGSSDSSSAPVVRQDRADTAPSVAPSFTPERADTQPDNPQSTPRPSRVRRLTSEPVPEPLPGEDGSRKVTVRSRTSADGDSRRARTVDPRRAEQIRTLMTSKLVQIDEGADHFQVLGVSRGAPVQAVRNAFYELAKRLHPDRLRVFGIADSGAAQRLFASINQAFTVLSNPAKRAEYENLLGMGAAKARETEEIAMRVIEAEKQFQAGEILSRRNQWPEAMRAFEKAVELNPDEAEHHALLAWATWRSAPDKQGVLAAVKQRFQRAIALSPRSVAAYLYRGRVAMELGDAPLALDCFRKVLEFEPNHNEAQLQIRLIENRMNRDGDKKKSLLDRIKGR